MVVNKPIQFVKSDGGRSNYFKGEKAGDCVVRAIAIATGKDYKKVYDELFKRNKDFIENGRCKVARALRKKGASPRDGNFKKVYEKYILELGFKWQPTMKIGSGMTVHVKADELPSGTLILRLSKHLTCVKDGILYDTHDCSREGTRGVYGYWIKNDSRVGVLKCLNDLAAYYETCGTKEDWDNFGTICKKLKVLTIFDESHKLFNVKNNNS